MTAPDESDTPRTDAAEPDYNQDGSRPSRFGYVPADFARTLERELASRAAQADSLHKELSELRSQLIADGWELDPSTALRAYADALNPQTKEKA